MNVTRRLKIGTRGSNLALVQVKEWIELLNRAVSAKGISIEAEIQTYDTKGDIDKKTPLSTVENTDFFTDSLDRALKSGKIDIAIHSAKDLPLEIDNDTCIAAITLPGGSVRDVLVLSERYMAENLEELPSGMVIGTSSKRRQREILALRPDWRVKDIRGTIEERLATLNSGEYDAVVMAEIALERLSISARYIVLDFYPHPMQGRLAVTCKKDDTELIKLCALTDDRKNWGRLVIAGAGAGTKELLSLAAHRALIEADAVFYDQLVYPDILAGLDAELIPCGRRKGKEILSQEDTCNMIAKKVFEGKKVVRLKGGDPVIFSRIKEELAFFKEARIAYSIIPAPGAYQTASAYAELFLTSREDSSGILVSTGFPLERAILPDYDSCLTLAYYMSSETASKIASALIEKKWPDSTAYCFVCNAGRPEQMIISGTLGQLARYDKDIPQPAVLLIGHSIERTSQSWWEKEKKILVTGTNPDIWRKSGSVVHIPCIKLEELTSEEKDKTYGKLAGYDTIIFTSKHAVSFFINGLIARGLDNRSMHGKMLAAIGKVTARELKKYGLLPDLIPDTDSAEGLLEMAKSQNWSGKKILIPCSTLSHPDLAEGLRELGNNVDSPAFYDNVENSYPDAIGLDIDAFDELVFTSPSCVYRFVKKFGSIPKTKKISTPGETTRRAVEDATT